MNSTIVGDTVIRAIIDLFQDERSIGEGMRVWANHMADMSTEQAEAVTKALAEAKAKHSDPLRFLHSAN
jgi:hypothetical protein